MSAQLLIAELDHAIGHGSDSRRTQILSRVTDLFIGEKQHDDDQIRFYDEVMGG